MSTQPESFSRTRTAKRLVRNPAIRAVARCAMMCAIRAAHRGGSRAEHGCDAAPR